MASGKKDLSGFEAGFSIGAKTAGVTKKRGIWSVESSLCLQQWARARGFVACTKRMVQARKPQKCKCVSVFSARRFTEVVFKRMKKIKRGRNKS